MSEPLTKDEFNKWKDECFNKFLTNDFAHVQSDVSGMKKDIGWLKWLNIIIVGGILAWMVKDFLG